MPHAYLLRALPEIAPVPTSQLPPLKVGLNRFSALTDAQAVSQEITEHLCGENVELHHLVAKNVVQRTSKSCISAMPPA